MAEKLFINSYNALSVENPDCLKSSFSASANEIKITKFPFSIVSLFAQFLIYINIADTIRNHLELEIVQHLV
jgi:hypothetical protein